MQKRGEPKLVYLFENAFNQKFPINAYIFGEEVVGNTSKSVCIIGGLHGDEYNGIYLGHLITSFLKEKGDYFTTEDFSLSVIPFANPEAINFSRRYVPLLNVDLNRSVSFDHINVSFAGPIGSFIDSLAKHIESYKYVIDLHAGNKWLEHEPRIVIITSEKGIEDRNELKERIEWAKKFNLPYISVTTPRVDPNISNTLNYIVNSRLRKFGFTIEFGLGLRLNRFLIIRVFISIMSFLTSLAILRIPQEDFNNVLFDFIKDKFIFTNQEIPELKKAINFDEIVPHILPSSHITEIEKIPDIGRILEHVEIKAESSGFFVTNKHLGEIVKLSPREKESDLGYILEFNNKENRIGNKEKQTYTLHRITYEKTISGRIIILRKDPLVYEGQLIADIEVLKIEREDEKTKKKDKDGKLSKLSINYPTSSATKYTLVKLGEDIGKREDIGKNKIGGIFVSGLHGDEYDSVYLSSLLKKKIESRKDIENIDFLFFPIVNTPGLALGERSNSIDGYDINRLFLEYSSDDDTHLTPSQRIAKQILAEIKIFKESHSKTYLFDIHSGSSLYKERPQIRVPLPSNSEEYNNGVFEENLSLANSIASKNNNIYVIVRNINQHLLFDLEIPGIADASLTTFAIKHLKIPSLIFISGIALRLHPKNIERYADDILEGFLNYIENPGNKQDTYDINCVVNLHSFNNEKLPEYLQDLLKRYFKNFYKLESINLSSFSKEGGIFKYNPEIMQDNINTHIESREKIGELHLSSKENFGDTIEILNNRRTKVFVISLRVFPMCTKNDVLMRVAEPYNF